MTTCAACEKRARAEEQIDRSKIERGITSYPGLEGHARAATIRSECDHVLDDSWMTEPCPNCGCPGEDFDGHCCEDYEEERGICMNCGADMDYSPMHPWCPDCDEDEDEDDAA